MLRLRDPSLLGIVIILILASWPCAILWPLCEPRSWRSCQVKNWIHACTRANVTVKFTWLELGDPEIVETKTQRACHVASKRLRSRSSTFTTVAQLNRGVRGCMQIKSVSRQRIAACHTRAVAHSVSNVNARRYGRELSHRRTTTVAYVRGRTAVLFHTCPKENTSQILEKSIRMLQDIHLLVNLLADRLCMIGCWAAWGIAITTGPWGNTARCCHCLQLIVHGYNWTAHHKPEQNSAERIRCTECPTSVPGAWTDLRTSNPQTQRHIPISRSQMLTWRAAAFE